MGTELQGRDAGRDRETRDGRPARFHLQPQQPPPPAPQHAVTGPPQDLQGPERREEERSLMSAVRSTRTAQLSHIPPDHGKSVNPWRADKLTVLDTLQPDAREKKSGLKEAKTSESMASQAPFKMSPLFSGSVLRVALQIRRTHYVSKVTVCGSKTFLST